MTDLLLAPMALTFILIAIVVSALMSGVAIMTWIERRLSGAIQYRLGPNRVGPFGLFQPVADGIKFIMKEDVVPTDAVRPVFVLAPGLSMVTAICAFAVIPIGPTVELFGRQIPLVIVNLDGGVLLALAAASLGVYGIVCAGWASNSKYSLMGGLRASAQMISYELSLALAVIGVLLVAGTLRPVEIVQQQAGWFWNWNVFGGWQLVGFLIFLVAGYAETNRLPFDMPEAESELVAGYHTEYSSMKFSMFFMAEYVNMITSAALAVVLFLGGYQTGLPLEDWGFSGWWLWGVQIMAFIAKVGFFMFLFVWVRWTLPRFRYDQLMALGWKRLFPLALANLMFAAVLVAFDVVGGLDVEWAAFIVLSVLVLVTALVVILPVFKNAVVSALALALNLVSIAGLFFLLQAQFIGFLQVIVYAGAIMVLILFVLMLLNVHDERHLGGSGPFQRYLGPLLAVGFTAIVVSGAMLPVRGESFPPAGDGFGTVSALGMDLFTRFFYPFEAISLLLVVAMIGAVLLAKRRL